MKSKSLRHEPAPPEVGVYECEVHLRFRLVEEKGALDEQDYLLEALLEAFAAGEDEYMESLHVEVAAHEISELQASPQMRRRLIRLRNARD